MNSASSGSPSCGKDRALPRRTPASGPLRGSAGAEPAPGRAPDPRERRPRRFGPPAALLLAAALFAAACAPEGPDRAALERELLAADRAFARATAERGAEGWASFFLEEGEMLAPGSRLRGREAVREAMRAALDASGDRIEWEPEEADPAASGDTGITIGRYRTWGSGPEGPVARDSGRYVTLWRRDRAGRWRVRLDIGLPTPPSP